MRPEHLFRYDPGLKAQKPALAMMTAPVEWSSRQARKPRGLEIGDREIIGRFDPDHAPRLGELMPLGVDMAHARLFDPGTQLLIPQAAA